MSFYGKDPEPKSSPSMKRFKYTGDFYGQREISAQQVYFYESGHIGFWNDTDDDGRELVLAVKAHDVWEEEA